MNRKIKKRVLREETLVKTIRGIWESLDSHLDPTIPGKYKRQCATCGGSGFHKKCCVEYAEMILGLIKLL